LQQPSQKLRPPNGHPTFNRHLNHSWHCIPWHTKASNIIKL
jgi:hypothetical protein